MSLTSLREMPLLINDRKKWCSIRTFAGQSWRGNSLGKVQVSSSCDGVAKLLRLPTSAFSFPRMVCIAPHTPYSAILTYHALLLDSYVPSCPSRCQQKLLAATSTTSSALYNSLSFLPVKLCRLVKQQQQRSGGVQLLILPVTSLVTAATARACFLQPCPACSVLAAPWYTPRFPSHIDQPGQQQLPGLSEAVNKKRDPLPPPNRRVPLSPNINAYCTVR